MDEAWKNASQITISNCFNKADFPIIIVKDDLPLIDIKPEPHIRLFSENRRIWNIPQHSQAFSHKLTSNRKNWLSHTVFVNICLCSKFERAKNVFGAQWRIRRMYEYTDPHITCLPILAQYSWLFSENKRTCGSGLMPDWDRMVSHLDMTVPNVVCFEDFVCFDKN